MALLTSIPRALAPDKGVGTMITPAHSSNAGAGGKAAASEAPSTRRVGGPQPTPRSPMKAVNLELPDYVWTELKIRAAHRQTSVRHVVMTALKEQVHN